MLVDVGGYRLYIECAGTGSPTVVFEAGHADDHRAWSAVQGEVSRFTRACSYDRSGQGQSEWRPDSSATVPVPASRIVEELHTLLGKAAIPGPYVLTGHSMGGFYARLYTKRYPDEVAGLVLVDTTPESLRIAPPSIVFGGEAVWTHEAALELAVFGTGSRPLVVLERGRDLDPGWAADQLDLARRSSNAWLVKATAAGHGIHGDNSPLVAEAVRQVVAAVRGSGVLPPCASSAIPALGGECLSLNAFATVAD